ncbi:tetratricopeptide repeat protein [Sulfurimonas sp. SAG-AH-194-C21]|nr:tetratricopeptide repeat protein [Sulfurimonas sp. SAG-AH-194-C21]MDF1883584.1 tetratricopeptide repeat protein [Sulfurimonas sp. SAG-AH-194-C21]
MAELEEEIIIIDDSEAIEDSHSSDDNSDEENSDSKSKKPIIFAIIALILILIIVVTFLSLSSQEEEEMPFDVDFLDEKLAKPNTPVVEPSKLENMIAKANYLYTNGSKEKALSLYASIAHYSEAISQYNLGVAQLKNEQYQLAFNTFSKAIKNDEKRCVSAINAAVCALHLNDKESFNYYIGLAYAYLPYEVNSPLYSYYFTLISYYKKDYLNALNSLKNSTSDEYPNIQKNLKAKINALYENDYIAIEVMEKNFNDLDDFSLGLLYARVGDFTLAVNHFDEAIIKNIQPVKSQLALGLINIKLGNLQKAASQIKNITDMYPDEIYTHYPIKVILKPSLFNVEKAQYRYRNTILNTKNTIYQKIFAFSPYKIFNANQTISYIRKGNANIYIDNIQSAKEYLRTSSASSSVNIGITKAIKKALNLKIRDANRDLQVLVKIQPKHSILQYNLALTYAQMGDLKKANEHFLRSYYLDAKNYLSGIYAIMTSQLMNKNSQKIRSMITNAVNDEEMSEEKEFYKTLLFISENNYLSAVDWLDKDYKQRPLYLLLDTLIALKLNKLDVAQKASHTLTILLPDEILPHLLYIDSHFSKLKTKEYAFSVLNYLKSVNFSFNDLYYGPYITRYLYIQENLIIGKLYFLRQQLKYVLETTNNETQEIESALALASLFDKQFEESYTLYNHLIDELKVQDAYTLFLGAVASTVASHHGNAIALLELSKLKNGNLYESRYALALLYLEAKNNKGAVIQLSRIEKDGFSSNFFDFEINTNELLFKKNSQ